MKPLEKYQIILEETKGDDFRILFDCEAENEEHAKEQTVSAYPNCKIIEVEKQQLKTVTVTLKVTYNTSNCDSPENWRWEKLLDMDYQESIEVISVDKKGH